MNNQKSPAFILTVINTLILAVILFAGIAWMMNYKIVVVPQTGPFSITAAIDPNSPLLAPARQPSASQQTEPSATVGSFFGTVTALLQNGVTVDVENPATHKHASYTALFTKDTTFVRLPAPERGSPQTSFTLTPVLKSSIQKGSAVSVVLASPIDLSSVTTVTARQVRLIPPQQ